MLRGEGRVGVRVVGSRDEWRAWRDAVLSEDGPVGPNDGRTTPTLRLVALLVSNFWRPDRTWFPATLTVLARKTGLSRRRVGPHLKELVRLGWLQRRRAGKGSKFMYLLSLPESGDITSPPPRIEPPKRDARPAKGGRDVPTTESEVGTPASPEVVTPPSPDSEYGGKKKKHLEQQPSRRSRDEGARAAAAELDQDVIAQAIIAANRGMRANPSIGERFNPIPTGHASRTDVQAWLDAGIDAETILKVVDERARAYQPSVRAKQISSMGYFTNAVREAADRAAVPTASPATPDPRAGDRGEGFVYG